LRLPSAFRFGCFVNVLAMLAQALFAGEVISGRSSGPVLHLAMAKFLVLWGVLQLLLAISMKRKNLCPRWLLASVVAVLLAEILEFALGETSHLVLHVPLAVAIFGGAVRQLLWTIQMRSRVAMEETR
jgi:uncharacterized membrane protein HdeD (DUF308 family)